MNSWEVLGIAPTKDKKTIKKAYAKMLAKYHPEEYPEKFTEINEAYKIALSYADNDNYYGEYVYDYEADEAYENIPEPLVFPENIVLEKQESDSIFAPDPMTSNELKDANALQKAEAKKQAQIVLKELYQLINEYSRTSRFLDPFDTKVIKHFVSLDSFNSVKRNPFFVEKLAEVYFNNFQIKIIKDAFDLTDSALHTSHGDLFNALNILDTKLELRRRKNIDSLIPRLFIFAGILAFVAFIVWGIMGFTPMHEMERIARQTERPPVVTTYIDEVINIHLPWERGYIEATGDRDLSRSLTNYVNRRADIYASDVVGRTVRRDTSYDLVRQNVDSPTWVTFIDTRDSTRQARVRIQLHFR